MRRSIWIAAVALAFAAPAFAADKGYQVTGPVVDSTATSITVLKGKDNWQIAKDASTKVTGDPKKGDKVTVYYTMTATDIEAKPPSAAKKK
jgi:hypothetical protein